MDDSQVMRSMVRDDAYHVVRVLADGPSGKTELVTLGDSELLVRKRIPAALANATAWATVMGLHEPRLPRIEEIYQMPDELVVVYSHVEGRSLREVVDARGALPPEQAVEVVVQTCEAASALHAVGLVHRDITPGNVILASDGAHLVDLGIARRQKEGSSHDTSVLGTWGFAAPEQFGFAQTDARSDVYALGRLLGYALTGLMPATEEYERAIEDRSQVPALLAEISARASAFEPSARYQSAQELAEALKAALAVSGAVAHKTHAVERVVAASAFTSKADSPSWQPPNEHDSISWRSPRKAPAAHAADDRTSASFAAGTSSSQPSAAAGAISRGFSAAPLLARVSAVAVWLACLLWIVLVVYACRDAVTKGEPNWHMPQYAMCVVSSGGVIMIAREVYEALTRRKSYVDEQHSVRRCLKEVCKILGITLVLMLLCALLPSRG